MKKLLVCLFLFTLPTLSFAKCNFGDEVFYNGETVPVNWNLEDGITYDSCKVELNTSTLYFTHIDKGFYVVGTDKFGSEDIGPLFVFEPGSRPNSDGFRVHSHARAKRKAYAVGEKLVEMGVCARLEPLSK